MIIHKSKNLNLDFLIFVVNQVFVVSILAKVAKMWECRRQQYMSENRRSMKSQNKLFWSRQGNQQVGKCPKTFQTSRFFGKSFVQAGVVSEYQAGGR